MVETLLPLYVFGEEFVESGFGEEIGSGGFLGEETCVVEVVLESGEV